MQTRLEKIAGDSIKLQKKDEKLKKQVQANKIDTFKHAFEDLLFQVSTCFFVSIVVFCNYAKFVVVHFLKNRTFMVVYFRQIIIFAVNNSQNQYNEK